MYWYGLLAPNVRVSTARHSAAESFLLSDMTDLAEPLRMKSALGGQSLSNSQCMHKLRLTHLLDAIDIRIEQDLSLTIQREDLMRRILAIPQRQAPRQYILVPPTISLLFALAPSSQRPYCTERVPRPSAGEQIVQQTERIMPFQRQAVKFEPRLVQRYSWVLK